MVDLMVEAEGYLSDYRSPFCEDFLWENGVELDELYSLVAHSRLALSGYRLASKPMGLPLPPRMEELFQAAEGYLGENRDPFCHEFLVDNSVSLDEVYSMSEYFELALATYRRLPAKLVALSLVEG